MKVRTPLLGLMLLTSTLLGLAPTAAATPECADGGILGPVCVKEAEARCAAGGSVWIVTVCVPRCEPPESCAPLACEEDGLGVMLFGSCYVPYRVGEAPVQECGEGRVQVVLGDWVLPCVSIQVEAEACEPAGTFRARVGDVVFRCWGIPLPAVDVTVCEEGYGAQVNGGGAGCVHVREPRTPDPSRCYRSEGSSTTIGGRDCGS